MVLDKSFDSHSCVNKSLIHTAKYLRLHAHACTLIFTHAIPCVLASPPRSHSQKVNECVFVCLRVLKKVFISINKCALIHWRAGVLSFPARWSTCSKKSIYID